MAVADVDHDGKLDLVAGHGPGRLTVLHGNGDGTFAGESTITLPVEKRVTAVLIHDLDLDGFDDLVVSFWGRWTQCRRGHLVGQSGELGFHDSP